MINRYYLFITIIFSIQFIGYAKNNNFIIKYLFTKNTIYKLQFFNYINYNEAITELNILNNLYQYNYIQQLIKLNLIYAYYKINKFSLVQFYINNFLQFNYTNKNFDFILYIHGLIYIIYSNNIKNIYFNLYYSNIEYARLALSSFNKIILNYPNSIYTINIIKNFLYIKNNIVKYEIAIIKYYFYRNAYIAVSNRINNIIIEFKDIQTTRKALKYIKKSYRKLQLNIQSEKIEKII